MNKKINPNLAEASELLQLQGIGPKLAERIIENRPYSSIDDLLGVQGIGPSTLAQWTDELTLDPDSGEVEISVSEPEEKQVDFLVYEKAEGDDENEITPMEEENSIADEATFTSTDQFEMEVEEVESKTISLQEDAGTNTKDNFTRKQVLLIVAGSSMLAFILAVALMLGLLTGLNQGRLTFASPADVSALSLSMDSLSSSLTTQESNLQALRLRVDTLETLDDRMNSAEENINTLTDDLNTMTTDVDDLKEEVKVLNDEIVELETQVTLFTSFFENLSELFNEFFPVEGGGNE